MILLVCNKLWTYIFMYSLKKCHMLQRYALFMSMIYYACITQGDNVKLNKVDLIWLEVLTAVTMKVTVFWVVARCRLVNCSRVWYRYRKLCPILKCRIIQKSLYTYESTGALKKNLLSTAQLVQGGQGHGDVIHFTHPTSGECVRRHLWDTTQFQHFFLPCAQGHLNHPVLRVY
jgi:hypothetical protein